MRSEFQYKDTPREERTDVSDGQTGAGHRALRASRLHVQQSRDRAAKKAEIDAGAAAALNELSTEDASAKELAGQAKGIAIFPNIVKGGLGVGGETGDGVLRVGGEPVGYYNTSGASIGLQAGDQSYSQVLMFLTDEALASFRDGSGWEAGVDGSVTVLKRARAASSTRPTSPIRSWATYSASRA